MTRQTRAAPQGQGLPPPQQRTSAPMPQTAVCQWCAVRRWRVGAGQMTGQRHGMAELARRAGVAYI
jgi:hypothetical protein